MLFVVLQLRSLVHHDGR